MLLSCRCCEPEISGSLMRSKVAGAIVSAVILGCAEQSSAGGTLGRWCYNPTPNFALIIEIDVEGDGTAILRSRDPRADSWQGSGTKLMKRGDIYYSVYSQFGDRFKVDSNTGDWQLFAGDGPFDTAKAFEGRGQKCGQFADVGVAE